LYQLRLRFENGDTLDCRIQAVIALGRRDNTNQQQVDIDFANFGIGEVSRLHAFILADERGLQLQDFNSRNGTFLNGYKLIPMQHYPLKTGDMMTLGRIAVWVELRIE
jgi:pSer/pThr/pTyr-binding forkhead associated (FHA) protein